MKKILFAAYSLDVGGIETALITLIKHLYLKYDITLVLEKKEGIFLKEIPQNVKIITYKPNNSKIKIIRKFCNFTKQQIAKLRYKNKFDFSACYATYSYSASFIARTASKNSNLWVHNDYLNFYNNNIDEYKTFFNKLKVKEYKKIIFVSENDENTFLESFKEYKNKAINCNNLIDYKKIIEKSKESNIDIELEEQHQKGKLNIEKLKESNVDIEQEEKMKKDSLNIKTKENVITFLNVGRHEEKQKKLSRIIEATKKLNEEKYKFRVIFVGDGPDSEIYKKQAENINNIKFLGAKQNPYPYIKKSDCIILSSDFEGYPVVFIESLILGKPIITTEVSDSKKDIKNKFGIVVKKSSNGIYEGMKQYLENGFKMQKFNPEEYNEQIIKKIEYLINN